MRVKETLIGKGGHSPAVIATLAALMAGMTGTGALAQDAPAQSPQSDGDSIAIPARPADGQEQVLPPPSGNPAFIPPGLGAPTPSAPSVLVILAHPDDEITMAPVLSRIARTGSTVTLIFATSGDAGPGFSGMEPGEQLGELRENEARCSAFALGLPEPTFWQLGDGKLADLARQDGARQSAEGEEEALSLTARIAAIIAQENPRTIMTWGPDGGYGHADHRMISNAVTQVVQSMDDERPDLLYTAIPDGDRGDLPGFEGWATIHPSLITDRIRYEPFDLEATRTAVACYESQFGVEARTALADILHAQLWEGTVYFRLAFVNPR